MDTGTRVKHFLASSENYILFALMLLGALIQSGIVSDGGAVATVIGTIMELGAGLGYTIGRISLKNTDRKASALEAQALAAIEGAKVMSARDPS